ncbi:MAG: Do family serine endopeptidase [Planctomycetales bacterium]|nr:Do family serine endopeptidase [Planctomycetales bacterium]
MKKFLSKWWIAYLALPVSVMTVGILTAASPASPTSGTTASSITSSDSSDVANALSNAFREVSSKVLPAVVAIENRMDPTFPIGGRQQHSRSRSGQHNPFEGTPFEDMFPDGFPGQIDPGQQPHSEVGMGSGVIIDESGIVLTNNHVVAGNGKVIIRTNDGREFVASEVLTDPKTDIAVIKFKSDSKLVAAKVGNSDTMAVGDWVVALGQPFGLESTVTAGIVSATNRGVGITARENFIQTDAAINPGNSGGPLVNLKGEVIGINTAISSRSGGNDGVGFAVPSNLAHWVSDQLLSFGQVNRSYLGVGIQPVDYELSTQLGIAPKSGVVVTEVFPDTPAARSGLKTGDVIAKLGATPVTSPQQLQLVVEQSQVGSSIAMNVIRDGKPVQLMFKAEAAPDDFGGQSGSTIRRGEQSDSMGLEVSELSKEVASQLGMDNVKGVLVTNVQEGSSADIAGLSPGMVIVQVNRQDVNTIGEFEKIVSQDTDGSILLLVRTEQGSRFMVVSSQ